MNALLRRNGDFAVKIYSDESRVGCEEAARRANVLHQAGVQTPPASFDRETKTAQYQWVDGRTVRELYIEEGPASGSGELIDRAGLFVAPLAALAKLHRSAPQPLSITKLDPWRLVYRRLCQTRAELSSISLNVCRQAERCCTILSDEVANLDSDGNSVLHGDFHLGQIVVESRTGDAWLIDLDDLCLGPPEADLGNFAAHIITSADLYTGDLEAGFVQLTTGLGEIYGRCANVPVDPHRTSIFGAVALIRRALKLSEQGRADGPSLAMLEVARRLPLVWPQLH